MTTFLYQFITAPYQTIGSNITQTPKKCGLLGLITFTLINWSMGIDQSLSMLMLTFSLLIGFILIYCLILDFIAQLLKKPAQSSRFFFWLCCTLLPLTLTHPIIMLDINVGIYIPFVTLALKLVVISFQWHVIKTMYHCSLFQAIMLWISPFLIGIIPMIMMGSWFIQQLF